MRVGCVTPYLSPQLPHSLHTPDIARVGVHRTFSLLPQVNCCRLVQGRVDVHAVECVLVPS